MFDPHALLGQPLHKRYDAFVNGEMTFFEAENLADETNRLIVDVGKHLVAVRRLDTLETFAAEIFAARKNYVEKFYARA